MKNEDTKKRKNISSPIVGVRVYEKCVSSICLLRRTTQQREKQNGRTKVTLTMNRQREEGRLHVYISQIYIRNSSPRDYQSRTDRMMSETRRTKEGKKKIGQNEKNI